jgi:hypothetical protein
MGSFRYLKNHFRSIYTALDGEARAFIRPTEKNLSDVNFPSIMKEDSDLYLLRKNSEEIGQRLSVFNQGKLKSFLTNFSTFDNSLNSNSKILAENANCNPEDLLYSYVYFNRMNLDKKRFFAKYGSSIDDLKQKISIGYRKMADEIKDKNLRFLDNIGNYIFLQGESDLSSALKIRNLENFTMD